MQNDDTTHPIAPVTHAAYAHVETVIAQADGTNGASPWWHGWAVREAFEAGAKWQRSGELLLEDDLLRIRLESELEYESLRAKLDCALAVLRKVNMTPLDRWYTSGLNVEVAQILRDNEQAAS